MCMGQSSLRRLHTHSACWGTRGYSHRRPELGPGLLPLPPCPSTAPQPHKLLEAHRRASPLFLGAGTPLRSQESQITHTPRFSSIYKGRPRGPSTKSTVDRPQGTMGLSLHTRPDSRPRAAEWRRVKRDSMSPHALPTPSPACSKPQTHRDRGPGSTAWAERR